MNGLNPHIRHSIRRDMPQILAIESLCFPHQWDEADFTNCLRQRNAICMVAEEADEVLGYVIYELHRGYFKLINIAVAPRWQRRSVGMRLIAKMISKLDWNNRRRIVCDVHEGLLDAHLFFKACGFIATDVVRERFDNGEDAYRFELTVSKLATQGA